MYNVGMLGLRLLCMHLWLNLINWTIDIQEKLNIVKNLCTKSMESCSLLASQIQADFRPERVTYKTLHDL